MSRSDQKTLSLSLIAVCGVGLASTSHAQERQSTLEEILVTARKVEENLQETPIAITVLTGDELLDRQVFGTDALTQTVPNLQFGSNAPLAGNNSSSQVFIRGIGQTDPTSTVDPGVGMYIDDVYIGNAIGGSMALRDIASVQVLRGPQGTLFGRNTIGGAIVLTTTEPGDDFGGSVRVGGGSDSLIDASLALDIPLSEQLLSRFSFGTRKQDGYVKRTDGVDLGDTDTYTALAKFVWTPNDRLTAKLGFDYTKSDENGSPLVFATINEAATFPRVSSFEAGCPGMTSFANPVPLIQDDRCANDLQSRGPYSNNGTLPLESTLENSGASLNLTFDLSNALSLKSITAYREIEWTGRRDADNTPLTILHTLYDVEGDQLSQEFQLTIETDNVVGVAGLYYFEQTSTDISTVELNPPPPGIQRDSDDNKVDNNSWAVFTQWTYNFNDDLAVTLGGRYTEDEKASYPDQYDLSTPNNKQVPVRWYRDKFDAFTVSSALNYQWTDSVMTYVSYSEGFKGGGWNSHFNDPPLSVAEQEALQAFAPEEARTIELGFKMDLLNATLRLNGAIFTSDYTDMQVTYRGPFRAPPAMSGVAPFITNAGKASIDGAELELTWAPTLELRFDASLGYLDATIDELESLPLAIIPPGLAPGNVLPFAPELKGHLGIQYAAHVGPLIVTPRVDASYQDTTYFDAINTPEIAQLDSVTTVNASVSFGSDSSPWKVSLGINNATDETYPIAGNSSLTTGSGYAEIAYSRPRQYFGYVQYAF